ncbi:hypothetical protein ACHQM5_027466 [Ranunculus cassubicifolius]
MAKLFQTIQILLIFAALFFAYEPMVVEAETCGDISPCTPTCAEDCARQHPGGHGYCDRTPAGPGSCICGYPC